jgi:hypothetical protein
MANNARRSSSGGGGSGQQQHQHESISSGNSSSFGGSPIIIVPPPTPTNPIPALGVALRVDNREQLLQSLLFQQGGDGTTTSSSHGKSHNHHNHFLVFSDSSLRTLLLRQVWSDPMTANTTSTASTNKPTKATAAAAKTNANWDPLDSFSFLPRTVVGTSLLIPDDDPHVAEQAREAEEDSASAASNLSSPDHVPSTADVVTYIVSVVSLSSCAGSPGSASSSWPDVLRRLVRQVERNAKRSVRYQLLFVPQPDAMIMKVFNNYWTAAGTITGVTVNHAAELPAKVAILNSSNSSSSGWWCQLDLFPLETDVITLHANSVLRTSVVDQSPSCVIQHCARALLKFQDAVGGTIPRIQAFGGLAEEIVKKMMSLRVEEYHCARSSSDGEDVDGMGSDLTDNLYDHDALGSDGTAAGGVAAIVVMDRRVDCVTPMLTPLTYEGLLDEVFGIECGHLRVPESVLRDDDDDNGNGNDKDDAGGGGGAAASVGSLRGDSSGAAGRQRPSGKNKNHGNKVVALPLNSGDSLYAEVRDQHVEQFGTFLQNQARALKESHANFTSTSKKKDLAEIHQFVKQIPVFTQNLRSLTNHIQLAERIKDVTQQSGFREQWQLERSILEGESTTLDAIEELVAAQYPVWKLLRLLCLQSLCQGGIKASRYDSIKRDIVQTYGLRYLMAIANLEKAGLLSRREGLWGVDAPAAVVAGGAGSAFYSVRNSLHLIHAEVDTIHPDDIAYVSSGYAPLSVRLIQTSVKGFTHGREDVLKENLVPGPGLGGGGSGGGLKFVDVLQRRNPPEDLATALKHSKPAGSLGQWAENFASGGGGSSSTDASVTRKPTLVVFYVGGVTYMELASLRFLSKRTTFPYHILCLTSEVLNGTTLLRTLAL